MRVKTVLKNYIFIGFFSIITIFSISCKMTKSTIAFHEEPSPSNDSSLIYIYRVPSMVGAAVPWLVRLDGKVVASLKLKAYVTLKVAPGNHSLTIADKTTITGTGAIGDALLNVLTTSLDNNAKKNGMINVGKNQVYYFRSKGFKVSYVTRDEAIVDLVYMKYDKGKLPKR